MNALNAERQVAVIGAGAMGAGIAQVAAQAGHQVILYDVSAEAVERGLAVIEKNLAGAVSKGKLQPSAAQSILARVRGCADLAELADVSLVIEAIVERLDVKQDLFKRLEAVVSSTTLLASNTSSLSITALGHGLEHPERVVGMHFFNPPHLMKLVEVVSGLATDAAVAEVTFATAQAWGKVAVRVSSTPGFIVNRVARPFYGEALRLAQERAADFALIDQAMRDAGGFRMGPFELMDLVGHDVSVAVTRSIYEAYAQDPRYKPSLLQQELVDAGRYGRKTGQGFYDYRADAAKVSVAYAACAPRPSQVELLDGSPLLADLHALWIDDLPPMRRIDSSGEVGMRVDGVAVLLTRGMTATQLTAERSEPVVLFDLALDYQHTPSVLLAKGDQVSDADLAIAVGFFQALGKAVLILDDCPGLVVMRTVAMLANEGAEAVHQGVATAEAIDLAMINGVNYPCGPLAWAERVGLRRLVQVLDHLERFYRDGRYRASPLLRRRAMANQSLAE